LGPVVRLDGDIAEYCLECAMAMGADYAEVRALDRREEEIILRNGELDAYAIAFDSGFSVRVLADGGLGFASSNRWTREEARSIAEEAHRLARASGRMGHIEFSEEGAVEAEWGVKQRRRIEDVHPEEKISALLEVDEEIVSQGANVISRALICETELLEGYFVNSEGSRIRSFVPRVGFVASGITIFESGRMEQIPFKEYGQSGGWEVLEGWGLGADLAREVRAMKRLIEEGEEIRPGRMDLVCGPEVVGIACHESCGHPMEADRILGREMSQAGRSFIHSEGPFWIGARIGSELVTIVDDPTIEGSYGYYLYDDEGVKARRRYLYKNGVINEFLHNRETAARMGTRSNGSARSMNYDREPIVRMANTYLLPGDMTEEEIFEDIERGVYMRSFAEWNIDDVRFNQRYVGREAYLIEGGELGAPVARPIIETTTRAFWMAVDAVSREVEFQAATCGKGDPMQGAPVFHGGPMIRLRGVRIR
jgi:TldD protein